jgi:glutamate dehydrogenase (NAD(P)+)
MGWMMDTYSMQMGYSVPGVVTGKPLPIGGSLGREEATGRGVVYTLLEAMKLLRLEPRQSTAAVQGFGNVGSNAARILAEHGFKVLAVSESYGGAHNPAGLDIPKLLAYRAEHRTINGFPGGAPISNKDLLELECTVLVPAALSEVITQDNAPRLRCQILAEGANGPTTPEADRILEDRGVFIIPDILANSGGVIVSYFEWVQDAQQLFWTEEEVNRRLLDIMQRAFREVLAVALERKIGLRTAALMRGISRVAEAKRLRGVFP